MYIFSEKLPQFEAKVFNHGRNHMSGSTISNANSFVKRDILKISMSSSTLDKNAVQYKTHVLPLCMRAVKLHPIDVSSRRGGDVT